MRALILEHDKIWMPDNTSFRTFLFHHSMLVNRLNDAYANNQSNPDQVKNDKLRQGNYRGA